jgi:hypothetical protein
MMTSKVDSKDIHLKLDELMRGYK